MPKKFYKIVFLAWMAVFTTGFRQVGHSTEKNDNADENLGHNNKPFFLHY
jgi:hypothetical protein